MTSMKGIVERCVEWDTVNWSKALVFWETHVDLNGRSLSCLELGSRRGGLSAWLAIKGNHVLCSDYTNPKDDAQANHRTFTLSGTIDYMAVDATSIPFENHFDIIVFKSILGGISRNGNSHLKKIVINEIHKALKPGGKLLFAENLVASPAHQFLRSRLTTWGSYWNYLKLDEVKELFSEFDSIVYDTAGFLGTFGRNEFQKKLLGRMDTLVFDKLVSDKMKYMVFGVATK